MPAPFDSRKLPGLLAWLGVTFAAAFLGAIPSARAGDFYSLLARPPWAPPAALFGPVWTLLYLLMGIAAWLAARARDPVPALRLFLLQLGLNALWPWLFFHWHLGALAFLEILLLWACVLATLAAFGRRRPLAGVLLLPYLVWISFAAVLTWAVWKGNPGVLA